MKGVKIIRDDSFIIAKVHDKPVSSLKYKIEGDTMHIISTFTLPSYRRRGLASKLMQNAVEYAIQNKIKKIKIYCSFAKYWFEKHPEYTKEFESIEYEEDIDESILA